MAEPASAPRDFSGWRGGIGITFGTPSRDIADVTEMGYEIVWGGEDPRAAKAIGISVFHYWNSIVETSLKGRGYDFTQMADKEEAARLAFDKVVLRSACHSLYGRILVFHSRKDDDRQGYLPPTQFTLLPNTAGCYTVDDAVRTLKLARELLDGHKLVKLEVLGDPHTLFPNVRETLRAAELLVRDGFEVMVYTSDDPIVARELETIGCVAIMPLASLIGSGMGILNPWNIQLILERAQVPVIVDAGVGTASDAAIAMELGCAGVLMNTAVAQAKDPVLMASAMKKAVESGRERIPSPLVRCTRPSLGMTYRCRAGHRVGSTPDGV